MHSTIIEILQQPVKRGEYMTEDSFDAEEYTRFADYIQNVNKERENDTLKWIDTLQVFDRKGRELTLRPMGGFMDDWKMEIVKKAKNLDMTDWMSYYNMKALLRKTHLDCDTMICMNGQEFWEFGYFIQHLYETNQPGDKFYIGGILDYHF